MKKIIHPLYKNLIKMVILVMLLFFSFDWGHANDERTIRCISGDDYVCYHHPVFGTVYKGKEIIAVAYFK